MTDAARRYADLQWAIILHWFQPILSEDQEDEILEMMDDLWAKMDPTEQDEANRRAAMAYRLARLDEGEEESK